jgi:hypothetical protein
MRGRAEIEAMREEIVVSKEDFTGGMAEAEREGDSSRRRRRVFGLRGVEGVREQLDNTLSRPIPQLTVLLPTSSARSAPEISHRPFRSDSLL